MEVRATTIYQRGGVPKLVEFVLHGMELGMNMFSYRLNN